MVKVLPVEEAALDWATEVVQHGEGTTVFPSNQGRQPQEGPTEMLQGQPPQMSMGTPPVPSTLVSTSASSDPLIGAKLGKYVILKMLGCGGFGVVYKAHHVDLDRLVAIKFLRHAEQSIHKKLFVREAKAIAKLGCHPNIIQIHDFGEYQGQYYFVIEYVTSGAKGLLEHCCDGLPLKQAVQVTAQAAGALAYAHKKGFVHRDVKPENILIQEETDQVKLADFGLVSFYASREATLLGNLITGTPAYMSPEQASGLNLDPRTDVFSLGVTLYHLLCGKLPFEGVNESEVMARIKANQRTPLERWRADLPAEVVRIVDKATAHKPEDRYQSAHEMADDLGALLVALGEDPKTVQAIGQMPTVKLFNWQRFPRDAHQGTMGPKASKRSPVVAAMVGAAIVMLVLVGVWLHPPEAAKPPEQPTATPTAVSAPQQPEATVTQPVAPQPPPPGPAQSLAPQELNITFSPENPEKTQYHFGELISFHVRAGADCRVLLFCTDSAGEITVLFPNVFQQDLIIPANRDVTVPNPHVVRELSGAGALRAGPPAGPVALALYASRESFQLDLTGLDRRTRPYLVLPAGETVDGFLKRIGFSTAAQRSIEFEVWP